MSTFPTGTFKLPAFDNTLGALQISLIISSVWVFCAIIFSGCLDDSDRKCSRWGVNWHRLFGITCVQTYTYFLKCMNDHIILKTAVRWWNSFVHPEILIEWVGCNTVVFSKVYKAASIPDVRLLCSQLSRNRTPCARGNHSISLHGQKLCRSASHVDHSLVRTTLYQMWHNNETIRHRSFSVRIDEKSLKQLILNSILIIGRNGCHGEKLWGCCGRHLSSALCQAFVFSAITRWVNHVVLAARMTNSLP